MFTISWPEPLRVLVPVQRTPPPKTIPTPTPMPPVTYQL